MTSIQEVHSSLCRELSRQLLSRGHQDNPSPTAVSLLPTPGEQSAQDLFQTLIPGHVPDPNINDQLHLQVLLDSNFWSTIKQKATST